MTDNNLQYRYPGTRPFDANDSKIFMGREEDIENLQQKMDIQKLLVLFSRSGLGKSSLINARLVSALKEDSDVMPIPVRIGAFVKSTETETVTPVEKFISSVSSKFNINQSNLIDSKVFNTEKVVSHHLWYFIKGLQLSGIDQNTFVFIFDQFEELFTYPDEVVKEFGKALAELFFVSVPQQLRTVLLAKRQSNPEELTVEERKRLTTPINIKFLMAIRSDKMSLLNKLSPYFPSILQNCYELKPLNRSQATQAIVGPAKLEGDYISPSFEYTDAAVKKILDGLSESANDMSASKPEEIESFQLQIVCKYVENLVIKNNDRNIDADDLGEINVIFENHYRNIIASLPKDDQLPARKLLEEKLIVDGIRISMPRVSILKEPGMTAELLDALVETHILRPEQNNYYEVAHDTLILPIIKYYDERKLEELEESKLKEQEEKNKKDKEILEAKLAEQVRNARRRKKRLQNILMILGIVILGAVAFFLYEQNQISRNKGQAFALISKALKLQKTDPSQAFFQAYQAVKKIDDEFIISTAFDMMIPSAYAKDKIVIAKESFFEIVNHGKMAISSSKDGKDTIWDIHGKVINTFQETAQLRSVHVSPDGNLIVTGLVNGEVNLRNIKGELIKAFPKEDDQVTTAIFSPDSKSILLRVENKKFFKYGFAKLIDLEGKTKFILNAKVRSPYTNEWENVEVICADFTPDGNILTGSFEGYVHIWDKNGKLVHFIPISAESIMTTRFSFINNEPCIIVGSWDGIVSIWEYKKKYEKNQVERICTFNNLIVCSAVNTFSKDQVSQILFTNTYNSGVLRSWKVEHSRNPNDPRFVFRGPEFLIGHKDRVKSIYFDGIETEDELYTCSKDGTLKQWFSALNYLRKELVKMEKIKKEEISFIDINSPLFHKLTDFEKVALMDGYFKKQFPDSSILSSNSKITMN